jgi:hypothetical protein
MELSRSSYQCISADRRMFCKCDIQSHVAEATIRIQKNRGWGVQALSELRAAYLKNLHSWT